PRSIGPIYRGKKFGYEGGGRPGMIFFNDEGTENGGLTFTGSTCTGETSVTTGRKCVKGTYAASTHMSFDQFNQDQVLNLDYNDDNGRRLTGFSIYDRAPVDIYDMVQEQDSIRKIPDSTARAAALQRFVQPRNGIPLAAPRAFFGKDRAKNASVVLSDPAGNPRLRMLVDSLGVPRIEFLDASGKVTNTVTGTR